MSPAWAPAPLQDHSTAASVPAEAITFNKCYTRGSVVVGAYPNWRFSSHWTASMAPAELSG